MLLYSLVALSVGVVVDGAVDALGDGGLAVQARGEHLAPDLEVTVTQGRAVQAQRWGTGKDAW